MNVYCSVVMYMLLLATFSGIRTLGLVVSDERKCKYFRAEKMLKAKCYDMNLKEVPQFLGTGTEVLDLSFNRIKRLKKSSFERYKNLRYLLLYENMIQSIEQGTFSHLTSLEEIDLSNNALMTIPLEIFQLPSLRNLYVDSNDLIHLSQDLLNLNKPIQAPLEYINIADCSLDDIPDLGILPKLWHLNASSNPLHKISQEQFSTLCHLKSVDLTKTEMPFCQCKQINKFLITLGIKTNYNIDCDNHEDVENGCPEPVNSTFLSEDFQKCTSAALTANAQSTWILIAACVGAVIFIIMCIFYCLHKRKIRRRNRQRNRIILNTAISANGELLRNET